MVRICKILLIAINFSVTNAFLLGPRHSIQEYEVILSYGNLCQFIINPELHDEIAKISATYEAEAKSEQTMLRRSERLFQYGSCLLKSRKLSDTIQRFFCGLKC